MKKIWLHHAYVDQALLHDGAPLVEVDHGLMDVGVLVYDGGMSVLGADFADISVEESRLVFRRKLEDSELTEEIGLTVADQKVAAYADELIRDECARTMVE